MSDQQIAIIRGKEMGIRLESRILEENIQKIVAQGYRQIRIHAFGQHGIGGRLWPEDGRQIKITVEGPTGQRLGSMGFDGTMIEVLGPASDDVGWLNAGAEIIIHGNGGNGVANAMAQGRISVAGNIGARGMTMTKQNPRFEPPELWVLGSVGDYFGEFMAGGIAVVCGVEPQDPSNVLGYRPFVGMVGGRVYFRGPHQGYSRPDAKLVPLDEADRQWLTENLKAFLERIGRDEGRTQLKCKVCQSTFKLVGSLRKRKSKYYCPHCHNALYVWKRRLLVTIYKCSTDNCPHRIKKLNQLNTSEKLMQKMVPTHFKINYQYREYHFSPEHIFHSAPIKTRTDILRIHNSENILGLILTFYISFALSARKTSLVLREVFNIDVSHQTVLNYVRSAAYYAHPFNLKHKGAVDDIQVGDETYIKINGKYNYVWFMLCSKKLSVTAYHIDDNRGTQAAVAASNEAVRTADPKQELTLISDGNPAYTEAIHFLNRGRSSPIKHVKVIGLQNEDDVSEKYRPFKQLIERFNRSYKHHVKPAVGFNSFNGAMALTTLFVTHYNFLRPHMSLSCKAPIHIPELKGISTIQGKWVQLLKMMF